jgi:aryl-alcohol dehydrogenase-like predicted oxidoreductase
VSGITQAWHFGIARERTLARRDDIRGVADAHEGVTSSDEEARRVFDRALEAGINLVDAANVYTEGRSEELTGEWAAGKRDQLLIATKCRFPLGFGITHKPGPNDGMIGWAEGAPMPVELIGEALEPAFADTIPGPASYDTRRRCAPALSRCSP